MSKQILAIALCRVSSLEQLENNSLSHQRDNVLKAADELGAVIPNDGIWSGHVSSKKGVNYDRKDLKEMFEYCKRNPGVKYLIVQEVDRFMRSPDEQVYFQVKFSNEVGVKIWYADKPELNKDDIYSGLMRYMEGFRAAGSNDERQRKSINGQTKALEEGRYPFAPKPGYKRGYQKGIQEVHEVRGPILKNTLVAVASRLTTPTQALIEFNKSAFTKGHSAYKMDKFRKILTDPFYAGIIEIDKQVKVRNENGLHEPLITLEQHNELVKVMDDKQKTNSGPRKNGNPKYPVSNMVNCRSCRNERNGRLVGYDHTNGKNNSIVYEKYRCRSCGRLQHRNEFHQKIEYHFKNNPITPEGYDDLLEALGIVWKQREGQAAQEVIRLRHRLKNLKEVIGQKVEAATDPVNAPIKAEIMVSIEKRKAEVANLEGQLTRLNNTQNDDRKRFLRFAFEFAENMGSNFLNTDIVSRENRERCKQLYFPAGFWVDKNNKIYTPEVSSLITLQVNKKDATASNNSHLVQQFNRHANS